MTSVVTVIVRLPAITSVDTIEYTASGAGRRKFVDDEIVEVPAPSGRC